MPQLAKLIKEKHPGSYDNVDDATLEKAVLEKYPQYASLVEPEEDPVVEAKKTLATAPKSFVNSVPNDVREVPRDQASGDYLEPTTFWGGFNKSLKDQFLQATVGNSALQGAAHPQSLSDVAGLLLPSGIPQISKLIPRAKRVEEKVASVVKTEPKVVKEPKIDIGKNKTSNTTSAAILDSKGREIAPPQELIPNRPEGPWDKNIPRDDDSILPIKKDVKVAKDELVVKPKNIIDDWGNPVGTDYTQPPPTREELLRDKIKAEQQALNTDGILSEDDQILNLARHELDKLKQSYGVDSEEYRIAAQELADIARTDNAKSVGRSSTRDLRPKLTGNIIDEIKFSDTGKDILAKTKKGSAVIEEPLDFSRTSDRFASDTERMRREAENRPRNIAEEDTVNDWTQTERNNARYEGRNINDVTTPLTREQQIIKDSYDKIRAHENAYNQKFTEAENLLPEGEFYTTPPEVEAAYKAEQAALKEAHQKLVDRLMPLEKERLPDIEVKGFADQVEGITPPPDFKAPSFGSKREPLIPKVNVELSTTNPQLRPGLMEDVKRLRKENPGMTIEQALEAAKVKNVTPIKNVEKIIEPTTIVESSYKRPEYTFEQAKNRQVNDKITGSMEGLTQEQLDYLDSQPEYMGLDPDRFKTKIVKENLPPDAKTQAELDETYKAFIDQVEGNKIIGHPLYNADGLVEMHAGADLTKFDKILNFGGTMKSLMSGPDLSGLRQGFPLIGTPEYWKSIKPMVQAARSEGNFAKIQEAIKTRPNAQPSIMQGNSMVSKYKAGGLKLTDLGERLSGREEEIMSHAPEDLRNAFKDSSNIVAKGIRGVGNVYRGSNRAFTAYMNNLRATRFDKLVDLAAKGGHDINDPAFLKQIGTYINNATGRGSFGNYEGAAKLLNTVAFSPKLAMSRLHFINPMTYVQQNPIARKEAWKSAAAMAGFLVGTGELANFTTGAKFELDPRSADFGKIRIGNTRIDMGGGFLPYIRLLAQLATQSKVNSETGKVTKFKTSKYDNASTMDTLGTFGRTKESPLLSLVHDWASGEDFKGDPFQYDEGVAKRVTPMILQDILEVSKNNPELLPITIPASVFGAGVQSYDSSRRKRK